MLGYPGPSQAEHFTCSLGNLVQYSTVLMVKTHSTETEFPLKQPEPAAFPSPLIALVALLLTPFNIPVSHDIGDMKGKKLKAAESFCLNAMFFAFSLIKKKKKRPHMHLPQFMKNFL